MEANNKALAKVEKKVIALKAKGEEPDQKTKDKMAAAEAAVAADAEVKNQWAADDAAAKKAIDDEKDTAADLKAKYDAKAAEYNTVVEKVTKVVKAADKEEPKSGPSPDDQKLAANKAMLEKDAADAPQSSQRRAFVKLCEKLGIDCHVLKRRATENYFSDTAVKAIKGLRYETLDPYGKLSDRQSAWGKNENWRIAREMTREELDETDLGQFLKNLEC